MLRKALFLLMVMLTVPNFASAYNYWSITAKTSPTAIAGALSAPAGAGYATTASGTTNITDSAITSATYTVNPAPAGYLLSYVTIDGVKVTNGNYTVNKGTRINHTITAVYTTQKYTVTTSKTGNGYIDPTAQVAAGSDKNIVVKPGLGYKIGSVVDGGAVLVAGDGVSSATYQFADVQGNKAISVDFVPVPVVDAKVTTAAQTIATGASLSINGSSSTSSVAAVYAWTYTGPAGATLTPAADGKSVTFSATAAGSYTVRLTLTADGATADSATTVITVASQSVLSSNTCITCHSERDAANVTAFSGSKHANNPYEAVSCQTCHTEGSNTMAILDTATLCVTCHAAPYAPEEHTAAQSVCKDCHNPHAASFKAGTITESHIGGANLAKAQYVSATVTCVNCHAGANAAILAQFKESGHANPAADPWFHYDWRSSSRAACARCHNGTAFVAKLGNETNSSLIFAAADAGKPSEILNCSACHSDVATGAVRTPGAFTLTTGTNAATAAYPNVGASNLCVRCHGARETGDSIKNDPSATGTRGFINSHYLAAAGTVYNKVGYHFTGQTYDTLGYHKNVGLNNTLNTGNSGPCVACHMGSTKNHTWEIAHSDTCVNCHEDMTAEKIEEEKAAFATALEELRLALNAKGIYFQARNPYFFVGPGATDASYTTWGALYGAASWKNVMGAAFNYNVLIHEPGAFAHNRAYSLKLITDSIDFIDNGVIDNSAATSAAATQLASGIWKPNAGTSTNHSSISNTATCSSCHVNGINPTTADINATLDDANGGCGACHQGRVNSFITSAHYTAAGNTTQACSFCHMDANHGGPVTCTPCHGEEMNTAFETNYAAPGPVGTRCQDCHAGGGHPHSIKTTAAANLKTKCIECHSVALAHTGDVVKDNNNGVRAITAEFTKYSHHVTGVTLQDAHCAACHLEGKVENGKIVVDPAKHMADAKTHLRDADSDADFAWDPMAPDHTGMDNFCMSCHDDNGATSGASAAIQGIIIPAEGKTASATNPFGDTISNKYDKMQRPAVVDVKGQFDTTNPSHHAVMGSRYTGRTTEAGARQIANPAAFSANSSANLPGARKTLYEAGKLNAAYSTLTGVNGDTSLGDDSVLHCGDCHTVGQWKPGSAVNVDGSATSVAIGAHGSENAYMLRNTAGTDAAHKGHTINADGSVANMVNGFPTDPLLVCYNCHAFQAYGSPRANSLTHSGEYNVANFRCNSPQYSYTNYTTGTIITAAGVPMNQTRLAYKLGAAGPGTGSAAAGGNIYGIQCAACHNSGPANSFGGIHGSKVKTYKDGTGAAQRAYRFMPGLGNTMYNPGSKGGGVGSVDDKNWEQKSLATASKEGCYTLAATSAGTAPARVGAGNLVNGAEVFGTWGSCTDHTGSATAGGTGVTRKVIRPTTY